MKVKRITVHEYIGDNPPTESIFLFNDDCQLIQEILPSKEVHHRYQPNGKEFEELTYLLDGSIRRTRFEYDDEGDYVGEVCTDGGGRILYKKTEDWLKPGRVASSGSVWGDESIFSFRRYLRKDEQQAFIRGRDSSALSSMMTKGIWYAKSWEVILTIKTIQPGFRFGDTIRTGF